MLCLDLWPSLEYLLLQAIFSFFEKVSVPVFSWNYQIRVWWKELIMRSFVVNMEYEKLPTFCSCWKMICHSIHNCIRLETEVPKAGIFSQEGDERTQDTNKILVILKLIFLLFELLKRICLKILIRFGRHARIWNLYLRRLQKGILNHDSDDSIDSVYYNWKN